MLLSVAIVCRDNEATIGRTLASVAGLADEVVAVDSGSRDGTLELLERSGARVIQATWRGHVATKQLALEACHGAWVLSLDSDESLEPALRDAIADALRRDEPSIAGYELNRKVYYRGRPLHHVWQPEWRLRLVRRGVARWTGLDPHDVLAPVERGARVERLAGTLRHDAVDSFEQFLGRQLAHARVMARSLHAAGRRGSRLRLVLSPAGAMLRQLVIKRGFLDGWPGWVAAASTAAGTLMKHAILLELDQQHRGREAEEAGEHAAVEADGD